MTYLRDGTLDILGLQYYLTNGFEFPEAVFHPDAYVISVKFDDIRRIKKAEEARGVVEVYSHTGFHSYQIEIRDDYLEFLTGDVWIGIRIQRNGTRQFGCFKQGQNVWHVLEQSVWNKKTENTR